MNVLPMGLALTLFACASNDTSTDQRTTPSTTSVAIPFLSGEPTVAATPPETSVREPVARGGSLGGPAAGSAKRVVRLAPGPVYFVDGARVPEAELGAALARFGGETIFIEAYPDVPYATVIDLIDRARAAGIEDFALSSVKD